MGRLILIVLFFSLAGCAAIDDTSDFDRHRFSQLVQPFDPGLMYFDVTLSPAYPDGDPEAERIRMQWLSGWLRSRGACPEGYEILERRPFEFLEDNPRRHDLRYVLRCRIVEAG